MTDAQLIADVSRVVHDYAAAVDDRDWEGIAALLHEEVVLSRGEDSVRGLDAFREAYRPFLESAARGSRHAVTNVRVDQVGPAAARSRAYFEATLFLAGGTRKVVGRYEDDLVLVGERWLITHKRNVIEWTVALPTASAP